MNAWIEPSASSGEGGWRGEKAQREIERDLAQQQRAPEKQIEKDRKG